MSFDSYRYTDLLRRMQYYSFESKMALAGKYSNKAYFSLRERQTSDFLPWNLETFVMLSVKSIEINGGRGLPEKDFGKIMAAIHNADDNCINNSGYDDFFEVFFPSIAQQQFPYQEDIYLVLYRFYSLFTDNHTYDGFCLGEEFKKKYNCDYYDFCLLANTFILTVMAEEKNPREEFKALLNEIITRFSIAMDSLIITRDDYCQLIEKFNGGMDVNSLTNCLSPSTQYPFIKYKDDIFFPLPYLILRSCSSSLLFRLTEGNLEMRKKIGKGPLEHYLFTIISESGCYEAVFPEIQYMYKKNTHLSPDVIATDKGRVLLLDSKEMEPRLSLRRADRESIEYTKNRVARSIKQIYERAREYNYYAPDGKTIGLDSIWATIVILDDSFVPREPCFKEAAQMLCIDTASSEYSWMINHVKVLSLHDLECFCFSGNSLLDGIMLQSETGNNFDFFVPFPTENRKYSYSKFIEFKDTLGNKSLELVKCLVS